MYPQIGCSELLRWLGDDEVLVLDCRGDTDWHRFEVHIPGALRVPLEELRDCAEVLPDDELIVVCDCSPDGSDARRAYRLLRMRGRRAVCLRGGLSAWVTSGFPIEHHEIGRWTRAGQGQLQTAAGAK